MKIKVLNCINLAAPFQGETIRLINALKKEVEKSGGECVFVFPLEADREGYMEEFKILNKVYFVSNQITKTYVRGMLQIDNKTVKKQLEQIVYENGINLIHCHYYLFDHVFCKIAREKRIPIVCHMHNSPFDNIKDSKITITTNIKKIILRFLYNYRYKKSVIVAVGKGSYNCLLQNRLKNVVLVENAIDTNALEIKTEITKDIKQFLLIGTRFEKGVMQVLEASKLLAKRGLDFSVTIIYSSSTIKSIINFIEQNDEVKTKIKLIEQGEIVEKALQETDCSISSSSSFETFSYFIAESLYVGNPCIISDIKGTAWATDSNNVTLYEKGNSADLAKKMEQAILYGKDIEKCVHGSNFIKEKYNSNRWVNEIMKLYGNMVSDR